MKKYSEVKEKGSFDWNKFLDKDLRQFDSDILHESVQYSREWTTCAVGNQCNILPRYDGETIAGQYWPVGCPVDKQLRKLGMEFTNMIESMEHNYYHKNYDDLQNDQESAKSILLQIELRSSFLINEIKKQAK